MAETATHCVISARELAAKNDYLHALGMYLSALSIIPEWKAPLTDEFLAILFKMMEELTAVENTQTIFAILEKAIEMFPDNFKLHKETGNYRYRLGYMIEALHHFEKALALDSSDICPEKNLNKVKTCLFPRDRFRVLNDRNCNSTYKAAIKSCVTAADIVLDLDAGAGLLALYASRCNPEWIYGCETSTAMAELAKCISCDNGAHNIIIVDNNPSVTFKCINSCSKRCVVLTDSIDSGLFGDDILQSLYAARVNLTDKNVKIIPGKAEYFVVGVYCKELHEKYNLCYAVKSALNVTHMNVHTSTLNGKSYCSEDVHLYENIKYMTEPKSVFTIDFNNIQDIYEKLHNHNPYNIELTAMEDGEINMLIGWFNLYLTDNIILTSDPRSPSRTTAYQQAVFFDFLSKKVHQNELNNVPFLTNSGRLSILQNANTNIERISLESLAYLNDAKLRSLITESIAAVCVHLGQTTVLQEVEVVDLSPFPLFGIQLMKRGAKSLICLAKTHDDQGFLEKVLTANGISKNQVTILVTEYWSLDVFKNKHFHVIFSQIVDFNGDINVRMHWLVDHLKVCHLMPGGICLPSSVTVMGQLISSKYLEMNNRVCAENIDFRMAKHINRYQVSQVMHIDIARLEYDALSDVFEVASCDELRSDLIQVPILKDGNCTAILCWYKVRLLECWDEISSNRSNSFVQSMAYMTGSDNIQVFRGDIANVLRCVDPSDRSFKLIFDIDPN